MSVEPSERPTGAIKGLEDPPSFVPSAVRFTDRHDAGRQLAALLEPFREERPVVVGIARGGCRSPPRWRERWMRRST